jgi:hypothetical protein
MSSDRLGWAQVGSQMGSDAFADGLGCIQMDLDRHTDGLDGLVDGGCTVDGHGWMGRGGHNWASMIWMGVDGVDGFGLARMGLDWHRWVQIGADGFELV